MEALDTQPTSCVKIENPVVLRPAKANVHRLGDQAKDLAVAVSSAEGDTGLCSLLEQATRNLEACSNELCVVVAEWDRLTTSDVIGQSDIDQLNDMINAASGHCDGFTNVQMRLTLSLK